MFWNTRNKPEKLLSRYLDPSREWSGKDDQSLREWVRSSDAAREMYDKRIVAHRLMLGLSADTPSRVEQDRMMAATIDLSLTQATPEKSWFSVQTLVPLGTMALVAMLAIPAVFEDSSDRATSQPFSSPQTQGGGPVGEYIGSRGGETEDNQAAIGVAGVSSGENNREYEVLHQSAFLDDRLRFSYRCIDPNLKHLFLFGVQNGETKWYFPLPSADEVESLGVTCESRGRRTQINGDTLLNNRHAAGTLELYGVFTKESLTVEEMKRALEGTDINAAQLKERIPLDKDEVIHQLRINIEAGTYQGVSDEDQ